MPQKSKEEIYEYVLGYKNSLLGDLNDDKESLYHRADDIDVKFGSDLIILASAGIAVAGGIATSQSFSGDAFLQFSLLFSMFAMFLSIGGGLKYYSDVQDFWKKWGDLKNEQAGMVHDDNSRTVEELEVLLKGLKTKSEDVPKRSKLFARRLQIFAFGLGIVALCLVISGMLFTRDQENHQSYAGTHTSMLARH